MRRLLACVLLALLPLALLPLTEARGDDTPPPRGAWVASGIEHQGRQRTYRLYVPAGHDRAKAVPLVLALHGGGGTAEGLDRSTNGQLSCEADRRGWLVVCPQGVAKGWNDGRPLSSWRDRQRRGVDDVSFFRALLDHLQATRGIDPTRVYATGISNGGFMSFRLGLELSDRVAAIAPVTANLSHALQDKRPAHPVGLLVINGTADPLVPYAGGEVRVLGRSRGRIHSTDETLKRWAAFNGCTAPPKTVQMPDLDPTDSTRPFRQTWPGCASKAEVVLIRIVGGGHTWPGGQAYLPRALVGPVCRDFDAATAIFAFFARHRRTPTAAR